MFLTSKMLICEKVCCTLDHCYTTLNVSLLYSSLFELESNELEPFTKVIRIL